MYFRSKNQNLVCVCVTIYQEKKCWPEKMTGASFGEDDWSLTEIVKCGKNQLNLR